jgi:hypothetical protein
MVMPAAMLAREIAEGIQRENRQRVAITPVPNKSISQILTQAVTLLHQVCDDWGTTSLILNEYMELLKKWTETIQSLADPTDESIFDSLGTAYHTWMVQALRSKVQDSSSSSKLQGPSSKLQATKSTGKDMIFNCGSMENMYIHTPRTTPVLALLLMGGYLKLHDPSSKRQAPSASAKYQAPRTKLQAPSSELQASSPTIHAVSSKPQAPSSPLYAPSSRLQAPSSKLQAPSSSSKLQGPSSKLQFQVPRSKLQAPSYREHWQRQDL